MALLPQVPPQELGVPDGLGVAVGVPVPVGVAVAVPVGVAVGVPVGVAVGVPVPIVKARAVQLLGISAAAGWLDGAFGATA